MHISQVTYIRARILVKNQPIHATSSLGEEGDISSLGEEGDIYLF